MTTAHRPTWNPRKGNGDNLDNPSLQFSARDLPSNTKIKYIEINIMKKQLKLILITKFNYFKS